MRQNLFWVGDPERPYTQEYGPKSSFTTIGYGVGLWHLPIKI